jgi:hypothetical protein
MDIIDPNSRVPKNVKNGQMIQMGDDTTVIATFDDDFIKNEHQSDLQGRTVYDHYIQITIEYPGNNLGNYKERFTPEQGEIGNQWTERFSGQWKRFKLQKEQVPDGTPIELWPPLDKRRVLELKAMKIHTVEQISNLSDQLGPNVGLDWRKLRDMAQATLRPEVGQATISKLNRENEDLKARTEALEAQIASIMQAKADNSSSVTLSSVPLPKKPRVRKETMDTTSTAA